MERKTGLNRDVIKCIAIVTMLCNHIGNIFIEPGTVLFEVMVDIGYFTAITMCYFLVEGYEYTGSVKNYIKRLGIFALVSQLPFQLAFSSGKKLEFRGFNMMFTLLLCFLILDVLHRVSSRWKKVGLVLLLTVLCIFCDWSFMAPVFTLLFYWAKKDKKRLAGAYLVAVVLFGFMASRFLGEYRGMAWALFYLGSISGLVFSGICIVCFYNGRRMERGRVFSKWFFYVFYPAHLLILGLLRIAAGH